MASVKNLRDFERIGGSVWDFVGISHQRLVSYAKTLLFVIVGTRLAAGVDESEEPRCYLSQEMKPYLSSCAQVMFNGFNVLECCRINSEIARALPQVEVDWML